MEGPWRKTDVWHLVVGSVSLRRGQETIGEGAAWGDPTVWEILGLWNEHAGQQQPRSRDSLSHEAVCASDWQNQRNGPAQTLWHPE